jgi:hypothetical protein
MASIRVLGVLWVNLNLLVCGGKLCGELDGGKKLWRYSDRMERGFEWNFEKEGLQENRLFTNRGICDEGIF